MRKEEIVAGRFFSMLCRLLTRRLSAHVFDNIDVSDSVPLSVMSKIALISRSELFLVISSIFLVFAELLLEPSSVTIGAVIPASAALPGALFAATPWLG
eukprot:2910093-Pyramimonas_sp.AAC.1